jgi:hypothetical protein
MSLGKILDQVRDYYIQRFIEFVEEKSANEGTSVVHECAFADAKGNWVTQGKLALPMRGDMFVIEDGKISKSIQIDTDGMLSFEPINFNWPQTALQVRLAPFQWNWLQLQLHDLPTNTDWSPLRSWFFNWFAEEDPPEDEISGGIHFLSDPEERDGYFQLSIDLGTAPVDAFEELLDAVKELGVVQVHMGQFENPS